MSQVLQLLADTWALLADFLVAPTQRLYLGYLLTSALLALWVFWREGRPLRRWASMLTPRLWWSESARLDYQLIVFNALFKVALLGHFVLFGLGLARLTSDQLAGWFGVSAPRLGSTTAVLLYTLALTVIGDLTVYVLHRLMHRVPRLWAFHSVHHSATHLTPFTQLRLHPIELVLNNLRSGVVFGLLAGTFGYLAGHQVSDLTFLGANVFSFVFFAFGANLRHSHVRLGYWRPLEFIFISPLQHQVHHSVDPEHHDRNFGSKLALWDWAFGSLVTSRQVGALCFGLPRESSHEQSLVGALLRPFR